ncbi:protein translocase subunit SecD [Mucisphaera calidilacus]|uniref:Multifunctional fusion protein n=1 Tax=Mucisphaera calidilacus TaxID=2527982 RepID=A0A518BUQ8_9BACT|nr:protein translocase subunit SecD [Mucisphaera calidilacus]QDU70723.1 bifunctional preprotein translocase subunit SecD/SecF [Mucisphaera calidilacus]
MNVPAWKWILVLVVFGVCFAAFWPPEQRLKPGLDLAGGTTLVYTVDIPGGRDPAQVIDETIDVLRDRIDPTGTRNLVWRRVAGNRVEIQMALASPETRERREAYYDLQAQVLERNIDRRRLDAVVRLAPEARDREMQAIAGDDQHYFEKLQLYAATQDFAAALREPYEAAVAAFEEQQARLDAMPEGSDGRATVEARVDDLFEAMQEATRAYLEARTQRDEARAAVLAANIEPYEIQRVLDQPTRPIDNDDPQGPTYRGVAEEEMIAAHDDRAEVLEKLFEAWTAYEAVKGPLDDPNDLIALLRGSGVLEFRIAPYVDEIPAETYLEQLRERGPRAGGDQPFRWFEVDEPEDFEPDPQTLVTEYAGNQYILLSNTRDKALTKDTEGWQLVSTSPTQDNVGQPAVAFTLNDFGGQLMSQITGPNQGKPMAIILDNRVISAPTLRSKIGARGMISGGTGGFNQQELTYLIRTLKAGSLEGQLSEYPVSIKTTGSAAGADNIAKGTSAARLSLIVVSVFVLLYYLVPGIATTLALAFNIVIILGVMAMLGATFTLPGIAGIVLTIGMAVDANVLIFERIREELQDKKRELMIAVRNGYDKAFSSILDANLTTLLTCVILGATATSDIKGFAYTLGIGIVATLFTSLFATRVLIELYLSRVRSLPMLTLVFPFIRTLLHPRLDWIGLRWMVLPLSITLVSWGVWMVNERGEDLLDIEFRSGTQVSFTLSDEGMMENAEARTRVEALGEVSRAMKAEGFDPASLSPVQSELLPVVAGIEQDSADRVARQMADYEQSIEEGLTAEAPGKPADLSLLIGAAVVPEGDIEGTRASGFSVSSLITDADAVSAAVKAAFADVLDTTRPIRFADSGIRSVGQAPVFAIAESDGEVATLGDNIGRPEVTTDVTEFLGGVAIVLDDLQPPATLDDLEQRIERMRRQPAYEPLGFRESMVIPLDLSEQTTEDGTPLYDAVVVVTRDETTNYAEDPSGIVETDGLADTEWSLVVDALSRDTSLNSVSNFSSQVASYLRNNAIAAVLLSMVGIVAYIWIRFAGFDKGLAATAVLALATFAGGLGQLVIAQWLGIAVRGEGFWILLAIAVTPPALVLGIVTWYFPALRYGPAAIVALVHDVTITLGVVATAGWLYQRPELDWLALTDFKLNPAMIAAMLTIVGYSLNDTIVVFDRIRENRGRLPYVTKAIINESINQTISRTILTSFTTFLAVWVLYYFGGDAVHGFGFAMIIGVLVGTYSSIAIAAQLLLIGRRPVGDEAPPEDKLPPIVSER